MDKFSSIKNAFFTSSRFSQEILLDMLQDFTIEPIPAVVLNPEQKIILELLWTDFLSVLKPLKDIRKQFFGYTEWFFPYQKNPFLFSETLKEIAKYENTLMIPTIRRGWLQVLIEQGFVIELNEKSVNQIILTEQEYHTIQRNIEIIINRMTKYLEQHKVDIESLGIIWYAIKIHEIKNLIKTLQIPHNIPTYFNEDSWDLYINEIRIPFQKGSMNGIFVREFFRNEEKTTYYYDVLQEYVDRNISEKKANQKGSDTIGKINKKIEAKTKIKDFFARKKGHYYRENSL